MASQPDVSNPDVFNDDAEEMLIFTIRTYLQRVSSKLSATEFVDLVKAAIALLDHVDHDLHQDLNHVPPKLKLSLPESKRLLQVMLQTFGNDLSQPIPALGSQIPNPIASLVARLVRHQSIMRTAGVKAVCVSLVSQPLDRQAPPLNPSFIRTALTHRHIIIAPDLDTQAGLEDLAKVLRFERQLQSPLPITTKSEQAIAEHVNQAIGEFKAQYQTAASLTQPKWDNELSVSSPWFDIDNLETASSHFTWPSQHRTDETLKDETNS